MKPRFLLVVAGLSLPAWVLVATAPGCSNTIETSPGSGGQGGTLPDAAMSSSSSGLFPDAGVHDAFPDYTDPGCPDAGMPKKDFKCNPYQQGNGDCPPGEGCYIAVQYPSMPCGQETYASFCGAIGPGVQGSPCGGPNDCGAGFVCVVSGSGDQCVQLCHLEGQDDCPEGLVCEPIDVEGFGGCL
ncbi:MAG TPA: hypothetical protein VHB21_00445 [Minicystis sp.]|nr:hypothetical protein [Minicystis sp.]